MEKVENTIAAIGRACSWLNLAMVLLIFAIVVFRYVFNVGWIWLQESVTYLHAAVFMLGASWALALDGHVRVDIFYRGMSERRKAIVNLAGTGIFLVPFCVFILVVSFDYVIASWSLLERSREAGGLPALYLLKSLIPAMAFLLLLQALASSLKNFRSLKTAAR